MVTEAGCGGLLAVPAWMWVALYNYVMGNGGRRKIVQVHLLPYQEPALDRESKADSVVSLCLSLPSVSDQMETVGN